ncbi:MFS transporter [Mycobacterium kansasii]|uniref:DHA2 family efflux MFS transporter permease subunit n=1 Tax=Mycobacterium attenuatum TaxID=2341086 RepID=UPI000A0A2532|nr:DHA2 family efflux MFS transporter permease subunit [Mycobacterium attenuatum]ORB87556.1 MFS transporter [Mycobacterium kansasii]
MRRPGGRRPGLPTHNASREQRSNADKLDARLWWIAGVCVLGSFMNLLDTTVVTVAQHTFVATFGSTQAVVSWTITGYTLALAAVIPIAGWAADRFGTKRMFIGSVVAFTLGSLLCAVAPNITVLIVSRVLQGLGGGLLTTLTLTIVNREAGPKRVGRVMAVLGIPVVLAPAFGPVLGGWLIDSYSWQWIFWINLPVGVVAVGLAAIVLPDDDSSPSESFDIIGMLLLSPGLPALLYGMSEIPLRGTVADGHVGIPLAVGMVLIVGFVFHALHRSDKSLIDLRLLTNRAFTLTNVAMFFYIASTFGAGVLFPSYFQQLLNQTPLQAGVSVVPRGIGAAVSMPWAGTLMDRRGARGVLVIGVALNVAGMGVFAYGVADQRESLPMLLTGLTILGLGMGATRMPLVAVAMQTLAPHQMARGSTLIKVNQQVAAAVGTALLSVILTSQLGHPAMPGRPLPHSGLSHAYSAAFVVAVVLVALTFLPLALLYRKPEAMTPRHPSSRPITPEPGEPGGAAQHSGQSSTGIH